MRTRIEIRPGRWLTLTIYQDNPLCPTIFMLHGLGGRGDQWREQIKHLQKNYNLIVPDLLGQGDSDKPRPAQTNPYGFEELSQDIQAIFERYSSDKNYVLGHSYGGAFAVWLTQRNQQKIQRLVLIAPVSCQPFRQVPLIYLFPAPVLEFMRKYLDQSFEKLAFASSASPALLKEEKAARDLNPMYVIKGILRGMRNIPYIEVNQLTLPCLIIVGKQDKLISPAAVKAFYGSLPQHCFLMLDDAAHMVQLEKNTQVNKLLDDFFA